MTPKRFDWNLGRYEETAAQLLPAAEILVDEAAPLRGERVVDVGCGTGNAALLAAGRGAHVTGVDPAARLLEVARQRAAAEALNVSFVQGEAAALPLPDKSVDLVLSVFGLIFAPDAFAAAAELARVTDDGSRIFFTAWIPGGAISRANQVVLEAVSRALSEPAALPPFPWHELDCLEQLFAPHGFGVMLKEHEIVFTADSARAHIDKGANHPLVVATRRILEEHGTAEEIYRQILEIFESGNENPSAFRITSRFISAAACRGRSDRNPQESHGIAG